VLASAIAGGSALFWLLGLLLLMLLLLLLLLCFCLEFPAPLLYLLLLPPPLLVCLVEEGMSPARVTVAGKVSSRMYRSFFARSTALVVPEICT